MNPLIDQQEGEECQILWDLIVPTFFGQFHGPDYESDWWSGKCDGYPALIVYRMAIFIVDFKFLLTQTTKRRQKTPFWYLKNGWSDDRH